MSDNTTSNSGNASPAADPLAFTIALPGLSDVLAFIKPGIATKRGALDVFKCFLIDADADAGTVTATAFDFEVMYRVTVDAQVSVGGRAVLPFAEVSATVKAARKAAGARRARSLTVGVAVDGAAVGVEIDGVTAAIPTRGHRVDDYPATPGGELPTLGSVGLVALAEGVGHAAHAAGTDALYPILTGMNVTPGQSGLTLRCTDRYRAVVAETPWTPAVADVDSTPLHVPAAPLLTAVTLFTKQPGVALPDRKVTVAGKAIPAGGEVLLTAGRASVWMRLICGDLPPIEKLFPDACDARTTVTIDPVALRHAIQRVGATLAGTSTPVALYIDCDSVSVAAGGDDAGQGNAKASAIAATIEGDECIIFLNPAYAAEALDQFGAGPVRFSIVNPLKPIVMDADDPAFRVLIMPIRGTAPTRPARTEPDAPPVVDQTAPEPDAPAVSPVKKAARKRRRASAKTTPADAPATGNPAGDADATAEPVTGNPPAPEAEHADAPVTENLTPAVRDQTPAVQVIRANVTTEPIPAGSIDPDGLLTPCAAADEFGPQARAFTLATSLRTRRAGKVVRSALNAHLGTVGGRAEVRSPARSHTLTVIAHPGAVLDWDAVTRIAADAVTTLAAEEV